MNYQGRILREMTLSKLGAPPTAPPLAPSRDCIRGRVLRNLIPRQSPGPLPRLTTTAQCGYIYPFFRPEFLVGKSERA